MKIIKKTKGMIDKFSGVTRKMMRKKSNIPFDGMQKYMTVGEYNVGAPEGTPHGEEYKLIVYKDTDNVLHQALRSINASDLAPAYVRKFDKRLNRYTAFVNKQTGRRYIVEDQLDQLVDYVKKHSRDGYNSINIGVLTDTHYKDADSIDWQTIHYTLKTNHYGADEDNIIPITDEDYFEDDIIGRLIAWLKVVYGAETLEENLRFIADALGTSGDTARQKIRNYFLKDFFKDHCKIYQKRPIYWLYDSGKQNGFKALIYMHRYNADTSGQVRAEYLGKMEETYESEINRMQDIMDNGAGREVALAGKRKEKLQKQLHECRDYDAVLGHIALASIAIDLDDGVKVNYEKIQTAPDGKKFDILAKI